MSDTGNQTRSVENKNLIEQINLKNININSQESDDSETKNKKIIKIGEEKIEENNIAEAKKTPYRLVYDEFSPSWRICKFTQNGYR